MSASKTKKDDDSTRSSESKLRKTQSQQDHTTSSDENEPYITAKVMMDHLLTTKRKLTTSEKSMLANIGQSDKYFHSEWKKNTLQDKLRIQNPLTIYKFPSVDDYVFIYTDTVWGANHQIACRYGNIVCVLDLKTGKIISKFNIHRSIKAVKISPDAKKILYHEGAYVLVNDIITLQKIASVQANHNDFRHPFIWDTYSKQIAVITDGSCAIYDISTGKQLKSINVSATLTTHSRLSWSPNKQHIAITAEQGRIFMWDIATNTIRSVGYESYNRPLIHWTADSSKIIIHPTDDTYIEIFNANATSSDKPIAHTRYADKVHSLPSASSPDGTKLAFPTGESIKIYGINDEIDLIKTIPTKHKIIHVAWSPDGNSLLTLSDTGVVQIWGLFDEYTVGGTGKNLKHKYLGRQYVIHTGDRGGKYIVVGKDKKKIYIRS
jgi:WD40 repeat protein